MEKRIFSSRTAALLCGVLMMAGCAAPQVSNTNRIPVDSDPFQGGMSSEDIRTVASQMTPAILGVPEIANNAGATVIKVADFKNNSRFFIDRNLFMKRLMIELNRHGQGKVRFLSNNTKVQASRADVIKDRQSKQIEAGLKSVAAAIAQSPILPHDRITKIAVIPVFNTNLVNMNAESFTAMLRSEIFNAAAGRVQFLLPGVLTGADYYLTGQFIPESMKTEGIINVANYIDVVDARVRSGRSMYITSENSGGSAAQISSVTSGNVTTTTVSPASRRVVLYENHLVKLLNDPAMRANPNVNKRLNIMLADAKSKATVYEKMIMIDRKFSDNSGAANYIISGEISGMHQRKNGISADYLVVSIQLTDPESNMVIWEDAYEVKRLSQNGIVYR